MDLSFDDVGILAVATCDFSRIPMYRTEEVLRSALPEKADRHLTSPVALRMIREFGVERRHLTHLIGRPLSASELDALDLARSALARLFETERAAALKREVDALILVSVSSAYPSTTLSAPLAAELGLRASCFDLKSGCSGGLYACLQAAALLRSGCRNVVVVMTENLSKLTPRHDLRMALTVGDGAAALLLGRRRGSRFIAAHHGTDGSWSPSITVRRRFPPEPDRGDDYVYSFARVNEATAFLASTWVSSLEAPLKRAGLRPQDFRRYCAHQTTRGNYEMITRHFGFTEEQQVRVVDRHGNMGAPTFAVALAETFSSLQRGDLLALHAVGGGFSWCSVLAEL